MNRVQSTLAECEQLVQEWPKDKGSILPIAEFAYVWLPQGKVAEDSIGVTVQAVTHGNEVGGITVVLELLKLLRAGIISPDFSVGLVLGNPEAAEANKRFIERDLNRSFGSRILGSTLEDKRAKRISALLSRTQLFLDLHQTIEPCLRPFLIFPYTPSAFTLARMIGFDIPIVTHWGTSFSADGMCSDEYVNAMGGIGITIELGEKGWDPYQSGLGLSVALKVLQARTSWSSDGLVMKSDIVQSTPEIYTWRAVVSFEEGMRLKEGLRNFQKISKGDIVGQCSQGLLAAPCDGYLFFPKYQRDLHAPAPKEIYRIAKPIAEHLLGQKGVVHQ